MHNIMTENTVQNGLSVSIILMVGETRLYLTALNQYQLIGHKEARWKILIFGEDYISVDCFYESITLVSKADLQLCGSSFYIFWFLIHFGCAWGTEKGEYSALWMLFGDAVCSSFFSMEHKPQTICLKWNWWAGCYLQLTLLCCLDSSKLMPHPCRILQKYDTFGGSDMHLSPFLKSLSNIALLYSVWFM